MSERLSQELVKLATLHRHTMTVSDLMDAAAIVAEPDQLRAELAAAKERGDGLYLGLRQTLEALGGVAQPGVSEAFLILGVPGEAAAIKRVNTALAADNARLRKALEDAFDGAARQLAEPRNHDDDQYALTAVATTCELAIESTPAQSLAAHDAAVKVAVLREVAETCKFRLNGGEWRICPETLLAEADRIEQEAPHA